MSVEQALSKQSAAIQSDGGQPTAQVSHDHSIGSADLIRIVPVGVAAVLVWFRVW